LIDLARGAWDRTAAVMYAIACCAPGGPGKGVTPDRLNKYRGGRVGRSLADWFGAGRAALAEKKARANGEPHGG
jgi:hypothetical protein